MLHAVHICEFLLGESTRCKHLSDCPNLFLGQFHSRVQLPVAVGNHLPTLRNHVTDVDAVRAREKMCRIHAGRIVAGVQYHGFGRERAVQQNPQFSMLAVAFVVSPAHPLPTIVGASPVYPGPEVFQSFFGRHAPRLAQPSLPCKGHECHTQPSQLPWASEYAKRESCPNASQ